MQIEVSNFVAANFDRDSVVFRGKRRETGAKKPALIARNVTTDQSSSRCKRPNEPYKLNGELQSTRSASPRANTVQSFPGITKLRAAERKQQVKLAHSRSHSASLLLGIPFRSAELHRISRSRQTDLDARDSFSAAQFSVAHHSRLFCSRFKLKKKKVRSHCFGL